MTKSEPRSSPGLRLGALLSLAAAVGCLSEAARGAALGPPPPTATNTPLPRSTNVPVIRPSNAPATIVTNQPPTLSTNPPPARRTNLPALPTTNAPAALPTNRPATATTNAAPTVPTSRVPRAPDWWYVTASRLGLRQGPGSQFPVFREVARGGAVNRLGETNDVKEGRWFQVRIGAGTGEAQGWLPSAYLTHNRALTEGDFANLVYGPVPKRNYPGRPARQVRGLYVSLNALGSHRFPGILRLARQTSINALVIDFKDDVGDLLTESGTAARLNPAANRKPATRDLPALIRQLKAENLYLIARIVTFKDPAYAREHAGSSILDLRTGRPYRSRDGLTWSSPYDAEFRAYNLGLADEAAAAGFDEVQFDYVRFPDVSKDVRLDYRAASSQTKAQVVQNFLLEARRRLEPRGVYLAADVFGLVCTTVDDMRIGQYWEAVSNAVDFICPMMYPSHYANGSYGLEVPDRHPFELVDRSLRDAERRNRNLDTPATIRPWLQGFTASWVRGHRTYGPQEIRTQIRALERHGLDTFLIWHPGGKYDAGAYR